MEDSVMTKKNAKAKVLKLVPKARSNEYMVNCALGLERVDDAVYARIRAAADAFEPVAQLPDSFCGNIYFGLAYDLATQKFKYLTGKNAAVAAYDDPAYAPLYRVMPSALWLYRLLCLFQCTVHSEGPDGYKTVWSVGLKHKATGEVIIFREWKGAFSLGHHGIGRVKNGTFERDLLALLTALASPDCPHPYDGTVAGSVA
jgi:hypothetical protein